MLLLEKAAAATSLHDESCRLQLSCEAERRTSNADCQLIAVVIVMPLSLRRARYMHGKSDHSSAVCPGRKKYTHCGLKDHLELMLCQQASHSPVFFFTKVQSKVLASSLHSRHLCHPLAIFSFLVLLLLLVLALLFLFTLLLLPLLCLALLAFTIALSSFWQLPACTSGWCLSCRLEMMDIIVVIQYCRFQILNNLS